MVTERARAFAALALAVACGCNELVGIRAHSLDASAEAGTPDEADDETSDDRAPVPAGIASSCNASGDGLSNCGAGESCCTSLFVASGQFFRTYSNDGMGPTNETDLAEVSPFRLDKYDVTVGRFRQFVEAWRAGWHPVPGSGTHVHVNQGLGLNAGTGPALEPGWDPGYDDKVQPTDANLACNLPTPGFYTWTPAPGGQELLPIDCVNWYESYAFCIWDGGFLPSEAEWEYAAAGGDLQQRYPWGSTDPGNSSLYAIHDCLYPSGGPPCRSDVVNIAPVGTARLGAGRWGQLDLVGNVYQWNLDFFGGNTPDMLPYPCSDCAKLIPSSYRVVRGSNYLDPVLPLTTPNGQLPATRTFSIGFRCARPPV